MTSDPRDYKLDIAGLPKTPDAAARAADPGSFEFAASAPASRPFLSVLFNCCRVYQRVYKTADGRSYAGRCPRCMRPVRFVVGPGGTGERSFVVE